MKKMFLLSLLSLLIVTSTIAGEQKKYGKEITLKDTTKVSDIIANPEKFDGMRVLVAGPIVDVCQERGCWIKIGTGKDSEAIRFKVDDGVIIFSQELKGKSAFAEGIVSVKEYSEEELIKSGEEHAKEEGTTFDRTTVKGPKMVLQIKGEGAMVEVE